MNKPRAIVRKNARGDYVVSVRGIRLRTFYKEQPAWPGMWMEFMKQKGISVHEYTEVQPSGEMPTGAELQECERHWDLIKHDIDNHRAKGMTPEQYQAERREARLHADLLARENKEKEKRLEASGWDDTEQLLRLLFSYKPGEYSYGKFMEDFKLLEVKRDAIASGITN